MILLIHLAAEDGHWYVSSLPDRSKAAFAARSRTSADRYGEIVVPETDQPLVSLQRILLRGGARVSLDAKLRLLMPKRQAGGHPGDGPSPRRWLRRPPSPR